MNYKTPNSNQAAGLQLIVSGISETRLCWETVTYGPVMFPHVLLVEAVTTFVLDYLFINVCVGDSPGG